MATYIKFSEWKPASDIARIYFNALIEYKECTNKKEMKRLKRRFKIASDFIEEFNLPLFDKGGK